MKYLSANKKAVVALLAVVALIVIGEVWWHRISLLERLDPANYYTVLAGEASEAAERGDFSKAGQLFRRAIKKYPHQYWAYAGLADVLLKEGNTNMALINYDTAIQYCGKSFTNLLSTGQQLEERRRLQERVDKLRQARNNQAAR